MSEGGLFPWKLQRILNRGPAADYSDLKKPLPPPPEGMMWKQDEETKERSLVKTFDDGELVSKEEPDLAEEGSPATKESLAADAEPSSSNCDDEWEFLSDKGAKVGSVRSITSMEGHSLVDHCSGSHTTLSVPFKIQRTASSSTIDSSDNAIGPAGKGVLGVDYVEHVILPTDTMQGICLAYKINSTRLRQANGFSGNSLLLAPKKLVIPISKKALRSGFIRVQDTDAKEFKLHAFMAECPDCGMTEAKAYLELADWVLKDALQSAKEDGEWEQEMLVSKSGEIRIKVNFKKDGEVAEFSAEGAGLKTKEKPSPAVTPVSEIPAIATKTVKAQDIYKAASQHDNFGVELKPLPAREGSSED